MDKLVENQDGLKKDKPDIILTHNKPYKDWKEERQHLRSKWGDQGRQIEPPASSEQNDT